LLKIADKTVAGVILPGVLLVLLMAIPYLDMNPSRRAKDRKVAIISGVIAGAVMLIWSWMGTPSYAVQAAPAIEVVQDLMPEEGAGVVREMGYNHLVVGKYDTRNLPASTGIPEFDQLLHNYANAITEFDEKDKEFNQAYGLLTVTQNQDRLRRIDWEIHWLDATGTAQKYSRFNFLYQSSLYWEQYGVKDLNYFSWPNFFDGLFGGNKQGSESK